MAAELDAPRLAPKEGPARQLVVFLHGYGADGNDLIEIGRAWQPFLPQAAFVSPHAPHPCGQAPMGREWFPLTFRSPTERWDGVNAAAPGLDSFLDAELARHNLPPSALALVGFSQGTMMALAGGLAPRGRARRDRRLLGDADPQGRFGRRGLQAAGTRPPAGFADPRRRRRPHSRAGAASCGSGAGRAGGSGRMAHLGRHRPRHRRRGPAPRAANFSPGACKPRMTA